MLNDFIDDKFASKRMLEIAKILSDGKPHPAAQIAQKIGIGSRTIRNDLHKMRKEWHLPIGQGRLGFFVQSATAHHPPYSTFARAR